MFFLNSVIVYNIIPHGTYSLPVLPGNRIECNREVQPAQSGILLGRISRSRCPSPLKSQDKSSKPTRDALHFFIS